MSGGSVGHDWGLQRVLSFAAALLPRGLGCKAVARTAKVLFNPMQSAACLSPTGPFGLFARANHVTRVQATGCDAPCASIIRPAWTAQSATSRTCSLLVRRTDNLATKLVTKAVKRVVKKDAKKVSSSARYCCSRSCWDYQGQPNPTCLRQNRKRC